MLNRVSTPSVRLNANQKYTQSNGELAATSDHLPKLLRAKDMIYPSMTSVTRMALIYTSLE